MYLLVHVHRSACVRVCVSETEQTLYSCGEVSSCADEGLKVCLSVSEAHGAQLLQLLLELLTINLTAHDRRVHWGHTHNSIIKKNL